jgi:hypothetical protein
MTHPVFAFVVVFASMVVYNGQLGTKVAIKFWWTQYPAYKVAFSYKTDKQQYKKRKMTMA